MGERRKACASEGDFWRVREHLGAFEREGERGRARESAGGPHKHMHLRGMHTRVQ